LVARLLVLLPLLHPAMRNIAQAVLLLALL
jgi:hypothetical protein